MNTSVDSTTADWMRLTHALADFANSEQADPLLLQQVPTPEERPCFRVFLNPVVVLNQGQEVWPAGVWHFKMKANRYEGPATPVDTYVCAPMLVKAITSNGQGQQFGRLLKFCNSLGQWVEWAMPMDMLAGTGEGLRAELLNRGLSIGISADSRLRLMEYLHSQSPTAHWRCTSITGWADASFKTFVLPQRSIGEQASQVVYQNPQRSGEEDALAGTLQDWQTAVAARAVGNPVLVLALCCAFAGPLLGPCQMEGGGVHLVGDSSTGKTTAIEAAVSVWGGRSLRRSWHATANGMAGVAQLSNDGLLALDEVSECDPKDVGAIIYALGNGVGKQRASRSGEAREQARWRCQIMSSGERSIGTIMGQVGQRQMAGQAVRMLDIPVQRQHGAWDVLHGLASGVAFSDAIKRASLTHHGHAGVAFLERLTRHEGSLVEALDHISARPAFACADESGGQVLRAAKRFALLALAGELATEWGITGWPPGEAERACAQAFQLWRRARQGSGNMERYQVAQAVADFIARHEGTRFSSTKNPKPLHNQAGWWREAPDGQRTYLFNSAGVREALQSFDYTRALDVLKQLGVLPPPGPDGKLSRKPRIGKQTQRVYEINFAALNDALDEPAREEVGEA